MYASDSEHAQITFGRVETEWPECKASTLLVSAPARLQHTPTCPDASDGSIDKAVIIVAGVDWARAYLEADAHLCEQLEQHHAHTVIPTSGEREPLTAGRRKDNAKLCKVAFHTQSG